jgi:hypothetical protein
LSALAEDLARELGIQVSRVLLISLADNRILPLDVAPELAGLRDGAQLAVVYFDEHFHTYSTAAQLGRKPELPNKLMVAPGKEEAPALVRMLVYLTEKLLPGPDVFLRGRDLSDVSFNAQDLRCSNFSSASLAGADFRGTDLSHSDLSYTSLRGADLRGATLSHACFAHANVLLFRYDDTTIWNNPDIREVIGLCPSEMEELRSRGAKAYTADGVPPSSSEVTFLIIRGIMVILALLASSFGTIAAGFLAGRAAADLLLAEGNGILRTAGRVAIGTPPFLIVVMLFSCMIGDVLCNGPVILSGARRILVKCSLWWSAR